jgi:hypothetical protein
MSRKFLIAVVAVLLTASLSMEVLAQPGRGGFGSSRGGDSRGRGGPSGGGFSRGGDSGRGGFSRGGDSGRGGPPGRFSGGGGFNMGDMVARMDTNGNKMLDPSEMQGRASFLIDRLSQTMRIDKNRPIPIDQIVRGLENMSRGRTDTSRGGSSSSGRPSTTSAASEAEPLVPGFDFDWGFDSVDGFGTMSEFFDVKVEEQDNKTAQERFVRYDRNKDGFLQKEELSGGRWSDDPFAYDRNKDGRLSVSEMAVRYAKRRVNESGGGSNGQASASSQVFYTGGLSSPSSSSGGGGSSTKVSKEDEERYGRMVGFMMSRYDANKNGALDKDEWGRLGGDAAGSDKNRDGKLDQKEMIGYMVSRSQSRGGDSRGGSSRGGSSRGGFSSRGGGDSAGRSQFFSGGASSGGSAPSGGTAAKKEEGRNSYRGLTPNDRLVKLGLDKELPDWFFEDDGNADGQVMMHEYASRWDQGTFDDFRQFDPNRDGVITAEECIAALEDGARKGSGGSSSSSRDSGRSSSGSGDRGSSDGGGSSDDKKGSNDSGVDEKYLKYARDQIAKYDTNKDRALTAEEWKNMSRSPEKADKDGDGVVTAEELALSFMKK